MSFSFFEQSRIGSSQILKNVASNWSAYLVAIVVNFFLAPFVVGQLGDIAYGVWSLLVSLTGYLGLLDFGVRSAVTRYMAKYYTESNHQRSSLVTSTALFFFTVLGAVAVSISMLLALFVPTLFNIPDSYHMSAQIVIVLMGISMAVSLLNGVFGGIIVGLQRSDLLNVIEIVITVLRALLVFVTLQLGGELISLAIIQLGLSVGRTAVNRWLTRRIYPSLILKMRKFDRGHLSLIMSFSMYAFLVHLAREMIYYSDITVIGIFLPMGFVTFFAIAGNLVTYASTLAGGIRTNVGPVASTIEAMGDQLELSKFTLNAARYCTSVVLPIYVTFLIRGRSFISMWMGQEYAELSGSILSILTLAFLFSAAGGAAGSIVIGIGRHKTLALVVMVEALSNLTLSIVLVHSLGVIGVAWGTTIPSLVTSCLFWPWYLRRLMEIPVGKYVVSAWFRPGVAVLPFALLIYLQEKFWDPTTLPMFFLQIGSVIPIAMVCFWILCVPKEHRQKLLNLYLRPLLPKLGFKK